MSWKPKATMLAGDCKAARLLRTDLAVARRRSEARWIQPHSPLRCLRPHRVAELLHLGGNREGGHGLSQLSEIKPQHVMHHLRTGRSLPIQCAGALQPGEPAAIGRYHHRAGGRRPGLRHTTLPFQDITQRQCRRPSQLVRGRPRPTDAQRTARRAGVLVPAWLLERSLRRA